MESTVKENLDMAENLRQILQDKSVVCRSVSVTETHIRIHGAWNHLPRVRQNLSRALNLRYVESVTDDQDTFTVVFERLETSD